MQFNVDEATYQRIEKVAELRGSTVDEAFDYLLRSGFQVAAMQYEIQHINKHIFDTAEVDDID